MIPALEKAKLEAMAIYYALGEVDTCHRVDFMAGAQAAWDLAVKYERERCLEILKQLPDRWFRGDVASMLYGSGQRAGPTTPPTDKEEQGK